MFCFTRTVAQVAISEVPPISRQSNKSCDNQSEEQVSGVPPISRSMSCDNQSEEQIPGVPPISRQSSKSCDNQSEEQIPGDDAIIDSFEEVFIFLCDAQNIDVCESF